MLIVVLGLAVLVVLAALDWRLSSSLARIDGAFDGLEDRPATAADGSITMLMIGTGDGVEGDPALAWMPGHPTVVSAMFVTLSGDRRQANVDWLPLSGPVLAGVEDAAPSASVSAAESWTGRRVDHLAVVDWRAFSELGRDNGVPMILPAGASRAEQQAFLRQVLSYSLHTVMRKRPWMIYRALQTVADDMAVEDGWSTLDMNLLAISLRNMRSYDIILGTLDEPASR